jgi:hypothetical protein
MLTFRLRHLIMVALVCAGFILTNAQTASAQCSAPNLVEWPSSSNAVWKLCWVDPRNSSGLNGSGLELTNIFYRGNQVMYQAHIPVLNVLYDNVPGACGGTYRTYRDWFNQVVRFDANNVISPGYAEPTITPRTACDTPGGDIGSFEGVAAQKLSDRLILTTHAQAGWYRYTMQWTFFGNGRIEPRMKFTAVDHVCTPKPHTHHAYWRYDFDIQDVTNMATAPYLNDVIKEWNNGTGWTVLSETSNDKNASTNRTWRARDENSSDLVVDVTPGSNDNAVDTFGMGDMWALLYNPNEIDDGGSTTGQYADAAHMDNFVNGQNIQDGNDISFWYRSGVYHSADVNHCEVVGPVVRVGLKPEAVTNLTATAVSASQINLSWTDNSEREDGRRVMRWNGTAWVEIANLAPNVTSFADTGRSASSTYYYLLTTYNNGGSASAPYVSATTLSGSSTPSLPAAPTNLNASAVSSSQINLSWSDNATNESGYRIDRSPNGSTSWAQVGQVSPNITSFQNSGLGAGTYFYRVYGYNSGGNSGYSNTASATVGAAQKTALLVVGSTSLNTGDASVKSRLEALGFTVTVKAASSSSTADATGKTLVLVSSTVSSSSVGTKFRDVTVPVIVWESYILDDMRMTATSAGSDFGTYGSQTQITVIGAGHPLAAGLSNGLYTVLNSAGTVTWGKPNLSTASRIATLSSDQSRVLIFGYTTGSAMVGMNAPAKRVGIFLEDSTAALLNGTGSSLFNSAINWATN